MARRSEHRPLLRFTNCRALLPDGNLPLDILKYMLHVDPTTGKIVDGQKAFYQEKLAFSRTIDLDGDYLVPGFIDVQVNGGFGIDFSDYDDGNSSVSSAEKASAYLERLQKFSRRIVETGVTSFVPTIITQTAEAYQQILPLLAPHTWAGHATSLGVHCEGPFISHHRRGAHCSSLVRAADHGLTTLEEVYGTGLERSDIPCPAVKIITLAPEVAGVMGSIGGLVDRNVLVSIGHTDADYDTARLAKDCGAKFITHLFNAMGKFSHRDPGVIGLLSDADREDNVAAQRIVPCKQGTPTDDQSNNGGQCHKQRPFYSLIADGYHSHPCSVRMAYLTHPSGCVLISDAMPWMDTSKPDGIYSWRKGHTVVKIGNKVTLEGTDTLAGSVVPLSDCVINLARFACIPIHTAAYCASSTPAEMLRIQHRKGFLRPGCDADLVRLDKVSGRVKETWIGGHQVYSLQ